MNEITRLLMEIDPTFQLHNEGFWSEPLDPKKPGFTSFNDAGIETETGEFLYSMARILKPSRILETGTHVGVGASYMGMALRHNNYGVMDTIEFLPEIHKRAEERMKKLGLNDLVITHFGSSLDFDPSGKLYKLILLDTEPQIRFEELIKFYPYLDEGGFVFIHDLHQHMHQIPNTEHGFAWPFGKIPWDMRALILGGKLRPMHFPTPRGFTGFYKPHSLDYKWPT